MKEDFFKALRKELIAASVEDTLGEVEEGTIVVTEADEETRRKIEEIEEIQEEARGLPMWVTKIFNIFLQKKILPKSNYLHLIP